jgi:hypothetical protein
MRHLHIWAPLGTPAAKILADRSRAAEAEAQSARDAWERRVRALEQRVQGAKGDVGF